MVKTKIIKGEMLITGRLGLGKGKKLSDLTEDEKNITEEFRKEGLNIRTENIENTSHFELKKLPTGLGEGIRFTLDLYSDNEKSRIDPIKLYSKLTSRGYEIKSSRIY